MQTEKSPHTSKERSRNRSKLGRDPGSKGLASLALNESPAPSHLTEVTGNSSVVGFVLPDRDDPVNQLAHEMMMEQIQRHVKADLGQIMDR